MMYAEFPSFNHCHKVGRTGLPIKTVGFSMPHRDASAKTLKLGAVMFAVKQTRHRSRLRATTTPIWLGGGLQEVISMLELVIVAPEGTIKLGQRVFPWARDCLLELKSAGVQIILLGASELDLEKGTHYDSLEGDLQLLSTRYPKGKTLVVGDSVSLMRAAKAAGMLSAFICSGQMSEAFQMSQAPCIDVPANGGHFSEPEDAASWDVAFPDGCRPDYGLACFAFSDSWILLVTFSKSCCAVSKLLCNFPVDLLFFPQLLEFKRSNSSSQRGLKSRDFAQERFFFRFFAERRAMARRRHRPPGLNGADEDKRHRQKHSSGNPRQGEFAPIRL